MKRIQHSKEAITLRYAPRHFLYRSYCRRVQLCWNPNAFAGIAKVQCLVLVALFVIALAIGRLHSLHHC